MFNISLCDFFLEYGNNYFANYADNTKIPIVDENTKEILTNRSIFAQKQYTHGWLTIKRNGTMINVFYFWVLKGALPIEYIQLEYFTIKCCKTKTLLGVNINNKLKFNIHVGIIGQKPNRKLNGLWKITNCMELPKNRILMNAFFYNRI